MCSASASPAAWCCKAESGGEAGEPSGTRPVMIAGMRAADEISAGAGCPANPRQFPQPASEMTRLSQLTHRNFLIATHDALATAFALLASFYLRFEGGDAFYRPPAAAAADPALLRRLQRVVCYVFNLTTTKWRFISLPDALEHPARGDGADGRADRAGLCLHLRSAERQGAGLVRPHHDRPLLVSRGVLAERAALRLSLFPLFARPPPCPDRRGVADAADRPRRRCRGAAARDRERRRQAALAGRRAVAIGRGPRAVDPQRSGARRDRRCRGRHPRLCRARKADLAAGHDPVGLRTRGASRSGSDAREAARPDRQPPAVARKRRRAAADQRRRRGPAAAAQRKDRLCASRSAGEGQGGHRDRRRRLDRFGNLRPRRDVRRRATAGDREFGAGALRGDGGAGRTGHRRRRSRAALRISAIANASCA